MTQKTSTKIQPRRISENVIEFPNPQLAEKISGMRYVNRNELTSISALTSYVAHNKNVPEAVVKAYLQAEFKIEDETKLRRDDYERVIKFLVDLQVDLILN